MEGGGGRQEGLVGLTLRTVLGKQKDRPVRTLLDIIRKEEPNSRAYANLIEHRESKKGWKFFKNSLNLNKRRLDGDGTQGSDVVRPDVVSMSNVIGGDRCSGSENCTRQALAQLLRACSLRIVEPVLEDGNDDDDSGEVPWAQPAQVQLRSQSWSGVASARSNEVGDEHDRVFDVSVSNMNNQLLSSLLGHTDEPVRSLRLSEALAAEREHTQMVMSSTEAPRSAQNEELVTETNNADAEQGEIGRGRESANEQQQQLRRSLMDLLDETDMLVSRATYIGKVYDHNDEEKEDGADVGSNAVEQNCCVCMVRHKGSAFIPCGHTFCRLCSRELWVNRGNCPICNGFILEILDIF